MASLQHAYKLNNTRSIAAAPGKPKLIKTKAAKRASRRTATFEIPKLATLVLVAAISVITGRLYQQIIISQTHLNSSAIQQKIDERQKINQELRYKLSLLRAPGRIQQIAMGKLGMTQSERAGFIAIPFEIEYPSQKIENYVPDYRVASMMSFF